MKRATGTWRIFAIPLTSHGKIRSILAILVLISATFWAVVPTASVQAAILDPPTPWTNFVWQIPLYNGAPVYDYQTQADPTNGGAAPSPDAIDITSGALAGTLGPGTQPSLQMAYYDGGTPGNTNIADDFLAFRVRLGANPQNKNGAGYDQYDWCILIDSDGDGWKEFVVDLSGSFSGSGVDRLYVYYNNNSSNLINPSTDLIEEYYAASINATGEPQTYNHTRVVSPATGGADNTQVWLDMQIPLTSLRDTSAVQKVLPTTPIGIYAATSASNVNPLQKDWMLATTDFVPVPMADLVITKSDSPDPTYTGGTLTYTLTITNNGPSTAVNVVVTDTYPVGFSFVSATPTPDTGTNNKWTFPSLASGASQTITITGTVTVAGGTITNTASVTSSTNDSNYANNVASQSTTVATVADVSITKSDSPDPVNSGDTLTYTLTIHNAGPSTATSVVVTESYPAGFSFVSATLTPDIGTNNKWTFPTLASGANQTIIITGTVIYTGPTITNTASVTSSNYDPNTGNNSDTEITTFTQTPAINIDKTMAPTSVSAPGNVTYTYVVTNTGNVTLTNVTVMDDNATPGILGDDFAATYVSGDTNLNNKLELTESWTYTATRAVSQAEIDAGTALTNTGTADSTESAPDTDTATLTITQTPAINIDKTVAPTSVSAPGNVTYTYVVTHTGNVTLTNVTVMDDNATPGVPGDDFAATYVSGDTNLNNKLELTESWTYTATRAVSQAEIDAGTALTNTGTADSTESAPDTDTATVTITQSPAIRVVKTSTTTSITLAGQVVPYTFTVTNTGDVTLTGITVVDPMSDAAPVYVSGDTNTDSKLQITETWIYSGKHTVTQAEIDAGGNLSSTVTADSVESAPDTDTLPIPVTAPHLVDPKTATLFTDADHNGTPSPGDTMLYTLTITNSGNAAATDVVFTDTPDANTTLVVDSVQPSQGTVTGGNEGVPPVTANLGTITGGGGSATVSFKVIINSPLPTGVTHVQNQGTVSSNELPAVLTDDPGVPGNTDPTVTQVSAAPARSVGGIAVEFPVGGSDSSSPPYAGIIGGAMAALAALALGVWFARRRWLGHYS